MAIQFNIFRIPVSDNGERIAELNAFLRSVQVLTVSRDFVNNAENSFVLLTIEYNDGIGRTSIPAAKNGRGKPKIDYKEILTPEDFTVFAMLREWRKQQAQKDAVAVYTIFTNEQLAQIAGKRADSKAAMLEIPGIGEAKVSKYAQEVLELVADINEKQQNTAAVNEKTVF